MPAMFALGEALIGDPALAAFAAFGSFAMVLLVDFGGSMRERLQAQAALAVVGGVFICLGTLASRSTWLAVVTMALVGFGVLFAAVISSVLAAATTSLLLAFILPVSLPGPASSIPDRLAGWGIASGAALLAVAFLWPAPASHPLRGLTIDACRALAGRLRADVAYIRCGDRGALNVDHDAAIAGANAAVGTMHRAFFATSYRPTGLGTPARMVVRLVDELIWLNAIVVQSPPRPNRSGAYRAACPVRSGAASVLECGADLLATRSGRSEALHAALADLRESLTALHNDDAMRLPDLPVAAGLRAAAPKDPIDAFITSLKPGFWAQELSFAVSQIAANIDLAAAAERRSWMERLLGRQPTGVAGTLSVAQQRAGAHVERRSVWLHNSVRGASALGLAVLVAKLTGVQHSFWVVLGALSVLRSNALSTGQSVVRSLLGTSAGFVAGGALVVVIGTNTTLLWLLLPPAVLLAGLAPAAISFAAGQAAFTLTVLILFNIIQPIGWRLGLVRIEDVALGCAVSLVVGLLFWPRGAGASLGRALTEAYSVSVRYLASAVESGIGRCDPSAPARPAPAREAIQAAAAAQRLDDTFRGFLAERGAKRIPLAEAIGLLTGVVGLRLAADAVLDLWQRDSAAGEDRAAARGELLESTERIVDWYERFASSLMGHGEVPVPLPHDQRADKRLIEAVSRDLRHDGGRASATAARMIWTADHLDATRRLQATLAGLARAATQRPLNAPSRLGVITLGLGLPREP